MSGPAPPIRKREAQGHEGMIFGFAAVLVFLCLAALYESWTIPLAVLLAVPLGLFRSRPGRLDVATIRTTCTRKSES